MSSVQKEHGEGTLGNAFSIWFTSNILNEDEDRAANEYYIGASKDDKLDIGICDDEHELITLVQCKFPQTEGIGKYGSDDVEEILTAKKRITDFPDRGNHKRQEFAKKFQFHQKDKPLKLIIAGFGTFNTDAKKYAIQNGVEIFDFKKIKERWTYLRGSAPADIPELVSMRIKEGKFFDVTTEDYEMFSFLVPIEDIHTIVTKYQDGIFEENLRYKLAEKSKTLIGKSIMETIKSNPQKLAVMNNGLTMTCGEMKPSDNAITLIQPQIVNGCQTSWAIFDVLSEMQEADDLGDLSKAYVPVRVIKTLDHALVKEVTKATNTQNPISPRDQHSKDEFQKDIDAEFNQQNPKILYLHRDGQLAKIVRENKQSYYRIKGRLYRTIDNVHTGQIYLALLGKPNSSRNEKRMIFGNERYNNTIFNYRSVAKDRFANDELNLTPDSVFLKTGDISFFIDDILFGFAIFRLSTALADIYAKKLDLYSEQEKKTDRVYSVLSNKLDFLTKWQYYCVAGINYVAHNMPKYAKIEEKSLREHLVGKSSGEDVNVWWSKHLSQKFKINNNKYEYTLLDGEAPSEQYRLFSIWTMSLVEYIKELVEEDMGENKWKSSRAFLDLKTDTYDRFIRKIDDTLMSPKQRGIDFPLPEDMLSK
ncbi:AIPR family protein [Candidatus Micrarchaeota archaeon]|nr:AIPR family protein [Candidatus Micrarchaeota archaeon]